MSYAAVAAHNAPSPQDQPRPDPGLLTTDVDVGQGSTIIDSASKLNVVAPEFKEHPHTDVEGIPPDRGSRAPPVGGGVPPVSGGGESSRLPRRRHVRRPHREDAFTLWQQVLDYVVRPQVAGGLLGVVNVGIIAGVGYTFYSKPHLRANTKVIASTVAATLALFTGQGVAVEQYVTRTPEGQRALQHARERRHWLADYLHNFLENVNPYKGTVGIVNTAIVGGLGYASYVNRNQPWDRRTVSAISAGLLALIGAEGYLLENSS